MWKIDDGHSLTAAPTCADAESELSLTSINTHVLKISGIRHRQSNATCIVNVPLTSKAEGNKNQARLGGANDVHVHIVREA
jgi:hypothetical protein